MCVCAWRVQSVDPQSPIDSAVAVQAALRAWEAAKAEANLSAPILAVRARRPTPLLAVGPTLTAG